MCGVGLLTKENGVTYRNTQASELALVEGARAI
jgi:hypothetical protein